MIRSKNIINNCLFIITFLFLINNSYGQTKKDSLNLLDYDTKAKKDKITQKDTTDYFKTVTKWTSVEAIHHWIKNNFEYDFNRAMLLANNSQAKGQTAIYTPQEFWSVKKGVCVDLSRFAYETAKIIDTTTSVKY